MRKCLNILAAAILSCAAAASALAGDRMETAWQGIAEAEVRLVASHVPGVGDMLGLQFAMAPKWKVYWRSPGDAGFPPVPDWSGSTGAGQFDIAWPLPERFTFYGLETFGYSDGVMLPIRPDPHSGPMDLQLLLNYAACADICVPVQARLALRLPAGPWPATHHARTLAAALQRVPLPDAAQIEKAEYAGNALNIALRTEADVISPDLIVEAPASIILGKPACEAASTLTRCTVPVVEAPPGRPLDGHDIRVTLYGENFATETVIRFPAE